MGSDADVLARLAELQRRAALGGGEERRKRLRESGRLTARERVESLFDPGTFAEIDALITHRCLDFGMDTQLVPGDGVVTGYGTVHGRTVWVFAQEIGRASCRERV